jgi:hypothetical protein
MKETCSEEAIVDACFAQIGPAHNHRGLARDGGLRRLEPEHFRRRLCHDGLRERHDLPHAHLHVRGRWADRRGRGNHANQNNRGGMRLGLLRALPR